MKKTYLYSLFARFLTLLVLALMSTNLAWGEEGDVLAEVQGTGSGYGRQTTTDSHNVGWVTIGQSGYFGINSANNNTGAKAGVNPIDLPVAQAVNASATSSTSTTSNSCTGYYTFYTTTALKNVGSIEFYYSANSGNNTATAYVVMGDVKSASGGAAYVQVPLATSSTSKQGVSLGTSGTFTFTFAETQKDAKYYGVVIATSSYKRMTGGKITIKEGAGDTPSKTLTSIAISGTPDKTTYEAGEEFDPTGLVVTGTYTEGDPEVITSGIDWTITPNPLTAGTTSVSVTAKVGEVESPAYQVKITVLASEGDKLTTTSVGSPSSYTTWVDKTGSQGVAKYAGQSTGGNSYIQMRAQSPSGIVSTTSGGNIRKIKVDWNSSTVNNRSLKIYGSNTAYTGTNGAAELYNENAKGTELGTISKGTTELTISGDYAYVGVLPDGGAMYLNSITFVWEAPKELTGIAVKTAPKTTYFEGDKFDPTGLVITANYKTGDPEDIAYAGNESKFTFSPTLETALAIANDKVTITYGGKTADQGITVNPVVLTSVVVSGNPTKKEYFVGESFNPAGLTVTGHYNNGTQVPITEGITWTITPETFTETTQNSVNVTATVGNITSDAFEVTGLTVTSPASLYTLTAEPAEGGRYTVTVGEDPAVEVTTDAKQFMVTEGTDILVEATPYEHFKLNESNLFEGKYDGETPTDITFTKTGVGNQRKFTYGTAAATITANFIRMYAVNIDENIEHGTVVADKLEASPNTGITLTLTPEAHYHFESLTVKDKNGDDITLEDGPTTTEEGITTAKFRMPAAEATKGDVNVTATFAEDAKYAVTFSIIGRLESKSNYADEQVEFPEVSNVGDYTFMGWTDAPIIGTQQTAPEYVTSATYPEHNNTLYYAVFAEKAGSENYVKVTSAPADWCGKYLIVYEDGKVAFDGSLETLDAPSNTKAVTISNNVIESSTEMDAIAFTVAYKTGSNIVYSLKSASGKYISGTTTTSKKSNGLKQADTDADYEISFNGTTIESKSSDGQMQLKYNKSNGQTRFRFYSSIQEDIALYKKQEATFSNYCTTVSGQTVPITIKSSGMGSFCSTVDLDFTDIKGIKAYIAVDADNEQITLNRRNKIPACKGIFVIGDANTYNIPIATDDCDDVTKNKLIGTIVPYTVQDQDKDNIWVLSNGKLHPVQEGVTIGAGKAYLNESLNAVSLSLFIVDEPTGVEEIKSQSTVNGQQSTAIFNLQGMRVSTPKKGEVYIMNGKKFLMK
ncbi:MAG: bacterial Ig-like domain-containing protein [Prevotella sp.]|nr:bacterial Ig-like domain-containing protein [Candidatus Equicola stercoris]